MENKPYAIATAIGSFPHKSSGDACSLIFDTIPEFPVWPQLPKISIYEEFTNQFSKRLPCFIIDDDKKKAYFNTNENLAEELDRFYSKIIEDDLAYFGLDEKYSIGFFAFIKILEAMDLSNLYFIKGQIAGPLSFGLISDSKDGKLAIYKPDIFDAIIKNCTMAARWQVKELKKIYENVSLFIDEPSLSILGSGYYSVEPEFAISSLNEIIKGIIDEGGSPGMHCCGNADWDSLMKLEIDTINFDASDDVVLDKFINSENISQYLERGKFIAWGMVPTFGEKIDATAYEDIEKNFYDLLKRLVKRGLNENKILEQSIITPSCGTGTLSIEQCIKVMQYTKKLSSQLRGTF